MRYGPDAEQGLCSSAKEVWKEAGPPPHSATLAMTLRHPYLARQDATMLWLVVAFFLTLGLYLVPPATPTLPLSWVAVVLGCATAAGYLVWLTVVPEIEAAEPFREAWNDADVTVHGVAHAAVALVLYLLGTPTVVEIGSFVLGLLASAFALTLLEIAGRRLADWERREQTAEGSRSPKTAASGGETGSG